jgi:two-component system LytT family sensor kinase
LFDVRELNISIEMWGVVFCVIGIVCVLLLTQTGWRRYRNLLVAGYTMELISAAGDALAGVYRGQMGDGAWLATHVGNFATFAGGFLLLAVFTMYLCERLEEAGGSRYHAWSWGVRIASIVMCVLAALGVFYQIDTGNLYHRSGMYWIAQAYVVVINVVNAVLIVLNRRRLERSALACLLFYALLPLFLSIVQVYVYGLNFSIIAGVLGLSVVFLEMQAHASRTLVERNEELARSRVEVSESRIAVMVSQIQPHFLFNTLDSIHYLCGEDSERAQKAIEGFSTYLRTNLDLLSRTNPVPIETELAHTRTYLELEKMSMEDLLDYEIDMQATGFNVPALSVQTIAENAAKHGVGKRPEGGKIRICTREEAECFVVEVADDGVGFDVESAARPAGGDASDAGAKSAERGSTHLGIENTRMRLEAMCGGELHIESEPGRGTMVTMRIPKKRGERA